MHTLFLILAVSLVAWGALSFGAVYPWAYGPLLVGSVAVGLLGMFMPGSRAAPLNRPLALSLAVLVLAVVLQPVPVPRDVILWLNPEADAYLRQADLVYALQSLTGESVWHPLSIRPDRTLLGLAFLTAFGLLLLGTTRAFSGSPDIKVGRSPGRSDQELCDLGRNRLIHGFFWDLPEQYFLASVDGRLRRPRSGWGACSAAAKSRRKAFNLWLLLDDRWAGDTAQVEPVR